MGSVKSEFDDVITLCSSVSYPLGTDPDRDTDTVTGVVVNTALQGGDMGANLNGAVLHGHAIKMRQVYHYARDKFLWGLPACGSYMLDFTDMSVMTNILKTLHPGYDINYVSIVMAPISLAQVGEIVLAKTYGYDVTERYMWNPPAGVDHDALWSIELEDDGTSLFLGTSNAILTFTNADGSVVSITTAYTDMLDAGSTGTSNEIGKVGGSNGEPYTLLRPGTALQITYELLTQTKTSNTVTRASTPDETSYVSVTDSMTNNLGEKTNVDTRVDVTVNGDGTTTVVTTVNTVVRSIPQYHFPIIGWGADPGVGWAGVPGDYPELDAWAQSKIVNSLFFPAIPMRIKNVDMADDAHKSSTLYKTSKRLLQLAGADIDKLADQLNDNENIHEIDYAFVNFGVQLNSKAQECKRYIFKFVERLKNFLPSNVITSTSWGLGGNVPAGYNVYNWEIFYPDHQVDNYKIKLQWNPGITSEIKTGQVFAKARRGDVEIVMGDKVITELGGGVAFDSSPMYCRKQLDADTYEEITICGLTYQNWVYESNWISCSAWQSFNEEDNEDFTLPLDYSIFRALDMVTQTDLGPHCMQITFNCIKQVKKKWYAQGWFQAILIMIALVVIVLSWGSGTGPVSAIYTSITTILIELGVTGALLIYLAGLLYYLVWMIIAAIINKVAVKLFGDKWGAVIAVIAVMVLGSYDTTGSAFGGIVGTSGTTAQSILNGLSAVIKIEQAYIKGGLQELADDVAKLKSESEMRMEQLKDLEKELMDGRHTDTIDIAGMTDATYQRFYESAETFLARTLIVGSDVCEITSGLVENFTEVGLQLPTNG